MLFSFSVLQAAQANLVVVVVVVIAGVPHFSPLILNSPQLQRGQAHWLF